LIRKLNQEIDNGDKPEWTGEVAQFTEEESGLNKQDVLHFVENLRP
jgi:hypothetical protein